VDAFALLKENNVNSIRLRIWNDPASVEEAKGYCDLAHTVEMAKKIKENDMHFMLDFHYSDYWADPGQQRKPHAWEGLSFEELKGAVYSFTREALEALKKEDCLPDIVQVGNEIRSGMLFPDGAVPNYANLAELLNAGIRAVRETSPESVVMIHLDQGGRFYCLKEWFDAVFDAGLMPIDAIGISFYSFWHGTFMDLKNSMEQLIERYHLPVYVVETAHPWRHCAHEHVSEDLMKTAGLPAGPKEQKRSLQMVMQIAATVSKELPTGVYYWEPLCIPGKTYGSWDENMGMLDEHGKALCSFEAFRDFEPEHPPIDHLEEYMESLYAVDEADLAPAGTNLVPNGDFSEGIKGWWMKKDPAEVEVHAEEQEIYVSAKCNFTFELFRDVHLDKAGKYRLSVDYRGTNTTGVLVEVFLKTISCNGQEEYKKTIFPSDVRFVTYSIDDLMLEAGQVQLGIRMNTPPVFGRIKNVTLTEIDGE
jgi:arabinogalactan endo-1,4-beta-galactosidase